MSSILSCQQFHRPCHTVQACPIHHLLFMVFMWGMESAAALLSIQEARPLFWVAGEGRVHQCLRDQMVHLTEACRQEELKLNIIQSRDIRLRPKLAKLCSEEIAIFCKDVQPGIAAIFGKGREEANHHCPLGCSQTSWVWSILRQTKPEFVNGARHCLLPRGFVVAKSVICCHHCIHQAVPAMVAYSALSSSLSRSQDSAPWQYALLVGCGISLLPVLYFTEYLFHILSPELMSTVCIRK